MSHKNKDTKEKMRNWELQAEQESQQDLRNQNEHMNNKYQQVKNQYTNFNNVQKDDNKSNTFRNDSDLVDKNSYMRYELNNTFEDKDDKKHKSIK